MKISSLPVLQALNKLRAYMDWTDEEVVSFFEKKHDEELETKLYKDLSMKLMWVSIANKKSQWYDQLPQNLYEEKILDLNDCLALGSVSPIWGNVRDREFLCIWGDGYVMPNDKTYVSECHGIDYFKEDIGFSSDNIDDIDNLYVGGSVEIRGLMEVMSVVRIA